jgi:type I restriction enzyme S subunit
VNAEKLLAEFDRLSEAPNASAHLRRFVLDLAVRGRLVDQDREDEPASALLADIRRAKARLVEGGIVRKGQPQRPIAVEDEPFEIPSTWEWVRFGEIAEFSAGRTPSRNDPRFWNTGAHAWVSIADMVSGETLVATKETVSEEARTQIFASDPSPVGTMIMSFKLTIGKIARLGIPAFHNEAIISIRPHLVELDGYLFKVLPAQSRQGATKDAIKGATLNRASIWNILIPLPPLAEQHRIVAKVDELMSLCVDLEDAQAERERLSDRLLASSMARLCEPSAEGNGTRHAVGLSTRLLTRPTSISGIRQAILDLAISGRLSSQHSSDEPVSELIARLEEEAKSGARRGRGGSAQWDVRPLTRPAHWDVVTVRGLSESVDYGTSVQASREPNGIPILRMGNLAQGRLCFNDLKYLRHQELDERLLLRPGDLLFNRTNSAELVGKSAVFQGWETPISFASYLIRVRPLPSADMRWVHLFLSSNAGKAYLAASRTQQTGQANINGSKLAAMPIPLPPVAEQRRVIARIDALMEVCDELERSLTAMQTGRARLLDAVLHEALTEGGVDSERVLVGAAH